MGCTASQRVWRGDHTGGALRTFPVIRDLVTDVTFNYEKAREIPSFTPPKDLQPGEYRMAQVDVERSQEFRKCIEMLPVPEHLPRGARSRGKQRRRSPARGI
jgi:succinate dehydrogenase/fumarate reductase-like Fe-S protein